MRGSTLIGTSGGGGNGRGCRGSGDGSAEGSAASECSGLRSPCSPCSPSPTGPPRALQHGKSPHLVCGSSASQPKKNALRLEVCMPMSASASTLTPPLVCDWDSLVPPRTISEAPDRKEFPERTE